MPLVPVQLPPGLERNNTPYDTSGRWWDMSQVRWQSGTLVPIGGWQRLTPTPLDSPVRAFNVWKDNAASRQVLVGTGQKLYVDSSGAYVDITPAAFNGPDNVLPSGGFGAGLFGAGTFGTARTPSPIFSPYGYWSFGPWGEDIVLTANTDGNVYYFDTSAMTAPTVIAEAPTGVGSVLVTPERHIMVIGVNGDPRQIAWCSAEDIHDWDFASVTNTAGFLDLTAKTPLLKGYSVAEGTLVVSYSQVFLIRFVGLPVIYGGTDPIADTALFNPASVVTFSGKAAWPSRLGFQLYQGGYVQPIDCPILSDILGTGLNVDPSLAMDPVWGPFRMHGAHNMRFPELTWFYPSIGNTECNRYVSWNYEDNHWTWGALARSAMAPADAYQYPYMGGSDGHVYEHEFGMLANGVTRVGSVFAESGILPFGSGDQTADINGGLIATGTGYGSVSVQVLGRYTPEGTEYTEAATAIRDDGYLDIRTSYRDNRIRFDMVQDGAFSLGIWKLDVTPGSGR